MVVVKVKPMVFKEIQSVIDTLDYTSINEDRKLVLNELVDYLKVKLTKKEPVSLNFICTHNSRRSQLAQVFAKVAAYYHDIEIESYSGGMEVTSFHENAVKAMQELGFQIEKEKSEENPMYWLKYAEGEEVMKLFSKQYDDNFNPKESFAAVMTCSQADKACPFVVGMEKRIALPYEDPKEFDGQTNCIEKYKERSIQIATELFYVFSKTKSAID